MAIGELLAVVPSTVSTPDVGCDKRWRTVQRAAGIALPGDYRDFALAYGSGHFEDPGRLMVRVMNPFDVAYLSELRRCCAELRDDRLALPEKPKIPYGVFPHRPGWLPWGGDVDGSLLCWLTEGEPDDWPIILLTPERTGFQQLPMSMTTFLALAFTRQIRTILWQAPEFFSGPEPIRFVPEH